MDIHELRRERIKQLLKDEYAGKKAALAEAAGLDLSYVSRLFSDKNRKRLGERLARKIELNLGKPAGWLDGARPEAAWRGPENVSVYGLRISQAAANLGREWEKIEEPLRGQIQLMIESISAMQVRKAPKSEARQTGKTKRSAAAAN